MYKKDDIFEKTLERSIDDYLDMLLKHEDIEVRSGVKATQEYIELLKKEILFQKEKNQLKDEYIKKLKRRLDH